VSSRRIRFGDRRTGLKSGHYRLQRYSVRLRWRRSRGGRAELKPGTYMEAVGLGLRVWGLRLVEGLWRLVGRGGFAVFGILVDGVAHGASPAVRAKGVDVFVLCEMDGLGESLSEISDGVGSPGFDVAANDGGDEASQGGAKIAGGEVVSGEEVGDLAAEFIGGFGLGFFAGVIGAEMRTVA